MRNGMQGERKKKNGDTLAIPICDQPLCRWFVRRFESRGHRRQEVVTANSPWAGSVIDRQANFGFSGVSGQRSGCLDRLGSFSG